MNKVDQKQTTVDDILWRHSHNYAGKHPVKIKITYNRKTKYYPVKMEGENVFLDKRQWGSIQEKRVRKENKSIKEHIENQKAKAIVAIETITENKGVFTFDRFEKEFLLESSSKTFIQYFEEYLQELHKENRVGTYQAYQCALQAFLKFRNEKDLDPRDVTPDLLRAFDTYLKKDKPFFTKKGKKVIHKASKTTVAMYMRALRVIYNYIRSIHHELN